MIPPILTLDVQTTSSIVASVNVLTSLRKDSVLQLEATQRNMELLLEEPKNNLWRATIAPEHKNVPWIPGRRALGCFWWDSTFKTFRGKSKYVTIDDNMADSDKRGAVMKAAASLQAFYDSHHNLKKNMHMELKRKRDRWTTMKAAESAHGEPVQKALK